MMEPIEKPLTVTRAVPLLYLRLAISAAAFMWEWWLFKNSIFKDRDPLGMFFLALMGWWLNVWLIYKIDQGRNWARLVYLILFIIGVPFFIGGLSRFFSYSIVLDGLGLTGEVLDIAAMTMLFARGASVWFRPAEADSPASARSEGNIADE